MDWGVGEYEWVARELEPAAATVVGIAGVGPGESVLDVGCGTGNAAFEAAGAGGRVTGVDPRSGSSASPPRRARELGLEATFLVGDAQALPFGDDTFDAVISVFAVIFAPDGERAATELVRVDSSGRPDRDQLLVREPRGRGGDRGGPAPPRRRRQLRSLRTLGAIDWSDQTRGEVGLREARRGRGGDRARAALHRGLRRRRTGTSSSSTIRWPSPRVRRSSGPARTTPPVPRRSLCWRRGTRALAASSVTSPYSSWGREII